jgi:hypothetical protein
MLSIPFMSWCAIHEYNKVIETSGTIDAVATGALASIIGPTSLYIFAGITLTGTADETISSITSFAKESVPFVASTVMRIYEYTSNTNHDDDIISFAGNLTLEEELW